MFPSMTGFIYIFAGRVNVTDLQAVSAHNYNSTCSCFRLDTVHNEIFLSDVKR